MWNGVLVTWLQNVKNTIKLISTYLFSRLDLLMLLGMYRLGQIFLLVDLREIFFRSRVGGTKK